MQHENKTWKRTIALLLMGAVIAGVMISPVGAHVNSTFTHLWAKHIKPKLSAKGVINRKANPVHWTKLKAVPRPIARPARLQLKFKSGCAVGAAIRSVTRAGVVTCEPVVTNTFFGQSTPATPIATALTQIKSLPLTSAPAGSYLVNATMTVTNPNAAIVANSLTVTCELVGTGGTTDSKTVSVAGAETAALALQAVHVSDGTGGPVIRCGDGHGVGVSAATVQNVTMSAVRASTNQVTLNT